MHSLANLLLTVKSIIKIIIKLSFRGNYSLKSKGGECFVLGSGPSLKCDIVQCMDYFSTNSHIFVMNEFVKSDLYSKLCPQYYVLTDPVYWSESISDWENNLVNDTITEILNQTSWKIILFIPNIAKNALRLNRIKENPTIQIIYYSALSLNGIRYLRNYWYKKNIGMPPPQTVLNAAIFLALNTGYKEVNILGADHTWIKQLSVGYDGLIYYENNHFYDREKVVKKPLNDTSTESWTIEMLLLAVVKMFQSHTILKNYASSIGAKIYNLTSDTLLDVYERKKIDTRI